MKFLLVVFGSVTLAFSQTDSMFVETSGVLLAYPLPTISSITFDPVVTVEEQELASRTLAAFVLRQNYPNPFNPTTNIEYELPNSGLVSVQILDVTGRLVRELDRGMKERGLHTEHWDGMGPGGVPLASGVYFCRVMFNEHFLTQKLLMLK
jgi:hypothetical protein